MTSLFQPGALVTARGREWTVLPDSDDETLWLRPLGGSEDEATLLYLPLEPDPVRPASFPPPRPESAGNQESVLLLRDSLRLKLRSGAGPFRSIGDLGFEPRAYQLVPLLMALKLETIRLLIADDVGVGKTIEAGLIAREARDRGMIERMTVLCPPHLCDQWAEELWNKFRLEATVVLSRTAPRLERALPVGRSLFEEYPITVVSLDFIKAEKRRDEFVRACPEFVIVEEAHTCVQGAQGIRHQRYQLLKKLSEDPDRHMLFLTATPHSGNDEAFRNLLELLHPDFSQFGLLPKESPDALRLRERLSRHFVQRRRPDIEEWKESVNLPRREFRELTYKLSPQTRELFQKILAYARNLVGASEETGTLERRLNWWAALALLRCVCSSPRAARAALSTRLLGENGPQNLAWSVDEVDALGAETVMDGETAEDSLSANDQVPGAVVPGRGDRPQSPLAALIEEARALEGIDSDTKLAGLLSPLKNLLNAGFSPIIFCRFIATADYLKEELDKALGEKVVIKAVTGRLSPEEREARVREFEEHPPEKKRLLIATDCLSEGINLQHLFNAVIHYDLSWNPTRHEQREGRVDRFGQPHKTVRALLYYGEDNLVDGIVLRVILRKTKKIRDDLGVSLSFPADSDKVFQAIMETVFFKKALPPGKKMQGKIRFTFDDLDDEPRIKENDEIWTKVYENEKQSRTVFAQNRLRPADVLPEWERTRSLLGDEGNVQAFLMGAMKRLGAPLEKRAEGDFFLNPEGLPASLRATLADMGLTKRQLVGFSPNTSGLYLHRSHPVISRVADYLAEMTLADRGDLQLSRSGALFSRAVSKKTVLYLVRFRHRLIFERKRHSWEKLAEELQILTRQSGEGIPRLVLASSEEIDQMNQPASRNMEPAQRSRLVRQALDELPDLSDELTRLAHERAETLLNDHQRVRVASKITSGDMEVHPVLPPDVLGLVVLMPDLSEGAR